MTIALLLAAVTAFVLFPVKRPRITFPEGKRFAFTIVDDTDQTTVERGRPLYDVLKRAGLRTTKTVWALEMAPDGVPTDHGESLQDPEYRDWILDLQRSGFEIGLHGVRGGSSERAVVQRGLEVFERTLGVWPRLHVNHALNRENLYWGEHRWSFSPFRWAFGFARPYPFIGHVEGSPYYWGDLALERIKYVRRFTFQEIDVLRVNPGMPYHMPGMPAVQYWFDGSDGGSIDQFERLLSDENLDRLERDGGVALVYAHLGAGSFNRDGAADPRFVDRIRAVARRNGWFEPASRILDHLMAQPGWTPEPGFRQRLQVESWFILDKVF
jgi:hypothetical protein